MDSKPTTTTASDPGTRIAELERRLRRRAEGLQFLQLITKTFVSLTLTEKRAICDTLLSLITTFLEVRFGAVLLDGPDDLQLTARVGPGAAASLSGKDARSLWRSLMDEKVAQVVSAAALTARWPAPPDCLRSGLAGVAIDIRERSEGLILVADKVSGEPLQEEDLDFLATTAGIAAMALTNADDHAARERLLLQREEQAIAARRETADKERALRELDQKLEIIERQQLAIRELSTPVLRLWDDVLALPIIGVVDTRRSMEIMERLLAEITATQSNYVILDITGVEIVDTRTADYLIKIIRAAKLLGTRCLLTGIRPAVAQTLVELGVDLSDISTLRTLQQGLLECLHLIEEARERVDSPESGDAPDDAADLSPPSTRA